MMRKGTESAAESPPPGLVAASLTLWSQMGYERGGCNQIEAMLELVELSEQCALCEDR